jgi:hypothetical protein
VAPNDQQHKNSSTRIDLPVYRAHRPIDAMVKDPEAALISGGRATAHPHRASATYYTDQGDVVMNNYLRHGTTEQRAWRLPGNKGSRDETRVNCEHVAKEHIAKLDAFIAAHTLKADVDLWRGINADPAFLSKLRPGTVFQDRAFTSTTIDRHAAVSIIEKFRVEGTTGVLMRIRGRPGQHGAYLEDVTNNEYEFEVLLPRGNRYRVVSVKPGKTPIVTLEIEP